MFLLGHQSAKGATFSEDKKRRKLTQTMTCKCHFPFELLRYDDHGVIFSAAIGRVDDFLFRYQSKGKKHEEGMPIEV